MKIRKAKKDDFEGFLELWYMWEKEYLKLNPNAAKFDKLKLKKLFLDLISGKDKILLVAEDKKDLTAFLMGTLIKSAYNKLGYIDDIFVLKGSRGKKVGAKLMKEFFKILKENKIKRISLGVNIKNKKAKKFYEYLGFVATQYEMHKTLK